MRPSWIRIGALLLIAWLPLAVAPGRAATDGERSWGAVTLRWYAGEDLVRVEVLCRDKLMTSVFLADQAEGVSLNLSQGDCRVQGELGLVFPAPDERMLVADLRLYPGDESARGHFVGVLATWK